MIITNLIGGLGNQMFQFAAGRALALSLGQPLRVTTDGFAGYELHHGQQLESAFGLNLETASVSELRRIVGAGRTSHIVRRLAARTLLPGLTGGRFVAERSARWQPGLPQRCQEGAYLHGYWQSERYFAHCADAVRADFSWHAPLRGRNAELAHEIHDSPGSVSLHIRRGDYLSTKANRTVYATCPVEYYQAAVAALRGPVPLRLFAFSDDPTWTTQALAPRVGELVVVDHNLGEHSHLDMRLMAMCRHHVIANSSFSWWGAWLDARPNKRVITPRRWFIDGRDDSDLVPEAWQKL